MGRENSHITHGHHTNRLPNTETDTRGNAAVQALNSVCLVDVLESVPDRHLLGSIGVLLLALHFHTDDLNGLVPGRKTTTNGRRQDLLGDAELLTMLLASDTADTLLSETRETEARAPVAHLADRNSVDALVDTADTLLSVDVHEGSECARGFDTSSSDLVLGDLDRLHAGAEAHGSIGLGDATSDTTEDAATELGSTGSAGIVFGLRGDEKQHGAFGRCFDPGPGD